MCTTYGTECIYYIWYASSGATVSASSEASYLACMCGLLGPGEISPGLDPCMAGKACYAGGGLWLSVDDELPGIRWWMTPTHSPVKEFTDVYVWASLTFPFLYTCMSPALRWSHLRRQLPSPVKR